MGRLLTGFGVGVVSLAGTAELLALTRLVLVQVRGLARLTRQLTDPTDQADRPWRFADCACSPGWALPPERRTGDLEP
jgi:hypothetical protein